MVRGALGLLWCALCVAGCGSSAGDDDDEDATTTIPGEPLDCAWFMSANNCWATTLSAAPSCLPPSDQHGTFSGTDGGACNYDGGVAVSFDTKVHLPLPEAGLWQWDFSIGNGANKCLEYHADDDGSQTLTVQGMTYRQRSIGIGVQVTCPDGSLHAAQDEFALVDCLGSLPGYFYSSTDTSVNLVLMGSGLNVIAFDCWQ